MHPIFLPIGTSFFNNIQAKKEIHRQPSIAMGFTTPDSTNIGWKTFRRKIVSVPNLYRILLFALDSLTQH